MKSIRAVAKKACSGNMCILLPILLGITSGCTSTAHLKMDATRPPLDNSVISPKLAEKGFSKIMVIPPSGTTRGQFELQMVLFEREFLRQGMSVISPAITCRVVLDSPDDMNGKSETASGLSDMERALIMAKNTGAEFILQVGLLKLNNAEGNRFFNLPVDSTEYVEVSAAELGRTWYNQQYAAISIEFIGKIVNVENGEILGTLDIKLPANHHLPMDYEATYSKMDPIFFIRPIGTVTLTSENFSYYSYTSYWNDENTARSYEALIAYVSEKISVAIKK
ncbi:MAG: hypothetical protein V3V05_08275 [Pontiella sp.]